MRSSVKGQVVNYKYWQTLRPVETKTHQTTPTKEAIGFEKYLQQLESENRMFEMGMAMRKASISTNKEEVSSIDALRSREYPRRQEPEYDAQWYLTRDSLVDSKTDKYNNQLEATVTKYHQITDHSNNEPAPTSSTQQLTGADNS